MMAILIVWLALLAPPPPAAGGLLDDAVSLYEAARYSEALGILEKLEGGQVADENERAAVAEYSALCLLALDREKDAKEVVRRLMIQRPDYRPRSEDPPPRFAALVQRVRAEVTPEAMQAEYRAGKARYDARNFGEAETHFRNVLALLDAVEIDEAARGPLQDISELANGYLGLIGKTREAEAAQGAATDRQPAAVARKANTVSPVPASKPFYDVTDSDVLPPSVIRQAFPPWHDIAARVGLPAGVRRAVLEVMIDPAGNVTRAELLQPLYPAYDQRLLEAARQWKYRPATRNGQPVAFRKAINVTLGAPAEAGR